MALHTSKEEVQAKTQLVLVKYQRVRWLCVQRVYLVQLLFRIRKILAKTKLKHTKFMKRVA